MKIAWLAACVVLAVPMLPLSAHAAEYARTVRLGSCVIQPGTTVLKLVKCAGQPETRSTSSVDLATGQIEDTWLYRTNNRTVIVHIASGVVTKVEVKAE